MRIYIARLGAWTRKSIASFGRFWLFAGRALCAFGRGIARGRTWRLLLGPMFTVGVASVPVIALTGLFVGLVLALQAYAQFEGTAFTGQMGAVVNHTVLSELGPVLAAVMLAGRVGGALTAELGTMKVTEQVDALEVMGVNPMRYLIAPRFMACLLMIPFLTVIADMAGVLGGYVVSCQIFGVTSSEYWRFSAQYIQWWDHVTGLGKSFFFGGAIGLIACYKGFTTKGGAQGVGRSCTEAFVASFIAILMLDFFLGMVAKTLRNIFDLTSRIF
jgi:phospholipid/cholesterol/gamma-HCH transport system permease protein